MSFVSIDNYYDVFYSGNSGERWDSIIRTIYFMVIVTIVQNGVGLLMVSSYQSEAERRLFLSRGILFTGCAWCGGSCTGMGHDVRSAEWSG